MRMRQETFKKSYYIPAFGKSIEIRRNQDIDEDGILGKELLAQYGEDCILEGETKSLMEKVASGDIGGSSLTTEQTAAIAKIVGLEVSASEIDNMVTNGATQEDLDTLALSTGNLTASQVTAIDNLDKDSSIVTTSKNFLTDFQWSINAGVLKNDNTILSGYPYDISELIPVKEGMVIRMNYSGFHRYDNNILYPDILKFSSSQTNLGSILSNAYYELVDTDKILVNKTIVIPSGVSFIRICGKFNICESVGYIDLAKDDLFEKYNNPLLNNLLASGRMCNSSSGGITASFKVSGYSSGFVAVNVGDTLKYRVFTKDQMYAATVYDSDKNQIRVLTTYTERNTEHEYTFNIIDDSDVAYVIVSSYLYDENDYCYLTSKNSTYSNMLKSIEKNSKTMMYNLSGVKLVAFTTTSTIVNDKTISINNNTAYIYINPIMAQNTSKGFTIPCVAVKFKYVSGETPINISWYSPSTNIVSSSLSNIEIGSEFTVYAASSNQLKVENGNNAILQVVSSKGFFVSNSEKDDLKYFILNNDAILNDNFGIVTLSKKSRTSESLKTELYGKKIVFFGDSVTASFSQAKSVADNLGATLVNLAVSGSTPYGSSNLSDTNLSSIPSDAYLVVLTGGTNAYAAAASGVISSRDRTTLEGTINYAIDWIYTNRPTCNIVLGTVQNRNGNIANCTWSQVYRNLGIYRNIPVIDIERESGINASNYANYLYDGVHPNALGVNRLYSAWLSGIRRYFS